jgi:hypothetical protein
VQHYKSNWEIKLNAGAGKKRQRVSVQLVPGKLQGGNW